MRTASLLLALLATNALAADSGRIGDLAYDPAQWRVERAGSGYAIRCRRASHGCDDLLLTARISIGGRCDARSVGGKENGARMSRSPRPAFDILMAERDLGCRNFVPPSKRACIAYRGRLYLFDAPVLSCRHGADGGKADAFLNGLRPG